METTTLAVGGDVPLELVNGKAPTEIRLLRKGKNPSTKGEYLFDAVAAQAVMDAYKRMGRPWVIADYDHGSLQAKPIDPSRSGRAAGRGPLELRDGDLWVKDLRWTPDAKAAIEAGEWPSISPAFEHGEDGRPTWLINFGLTGNPALHQPAELIAANVLRAALAAVTPEEEALPATEPEPAAQPSAAPASAPLPEVAATPAPPTGITQPPPAIVAASAITKTTGGAAPVTKANTKMGSTLGQLMAAKGKSAKDLAEMLGISEDEASALMAMSGEMAMESAKAQEEMLMGAVSLSIGISTGSAKPKVIERLSALAAFERDVLAVAGSKDHATALGALSGLVANEAQAKTAIAELAAVKAAATKAEIETLLSIAKSEKKLTPAEVEDNDESSLRATAAKLGVGWLKANLAKRTPIAALAIEHREPAKKPDPAQEQEAALDVKGFAALSFAQRAALRDRDEATYQKLNTELAKSKPAKLSVPIPDKTAQGLFGDLPA